MDFNFQVHAKGEVEESNSDNEAPSSVPLPGEPEIKAPAGAGPPTSVVGTSPSDLHGLEVRVTEAAQSPVSDI